MPAASATPGDGHSQAHVHLRNTSSCRSGRHPVKNERERRERCAALVAEEQQERANVRRRVGRVDTLCGRQVDVLHTNGSGGLCGVAAYKLTQGNAVAECNHALLSLREAEIELQPAELLVVLPEASR